jgi:hypothetical protein
VENMMQKKSNSLRIRLHFLGKTFRLVIKFFINLHFRPLSTIEPSPRQWRATLRRMYLMIYLIYKSSRILHLRHSYYPRAM